jgi:SAM-dependent methyltransferase
MSRMTYPGKELVLFSRAGNWKLYWSSRIIPYVGETILEVGAGIGTNTHILWKDDVKRWVCLEPDAKFERKLSDALNGVDRSRWEVINGTLKDLSQHDLFDTILYIDVLEHIEDDKSEIDLALKYLVKGGKLIILSPAHNWLFSRFDEAIGHFRRYDESMLRELVPAQFRLLKLEYLDSFGLLISLCNSMILRSGTPSRKQIQIWDSIIVPLSRMMDKAIHFRFGKSILAVWN